MKKQGSGRDPAVNDERRRVEWTGKDVGMGERG